MRPPYFMEVLKMEEIELQKQIEELREQLQNITAERDTYNANAEKLAEENRELRQWNNKLFMKVSNPAVENKQNSTVLTPEEIKRRYKDG